MFWKKKKKENTVYTAKNILHAVPGIKVVIKTDLGNVRTNNEDAASFFRVENMLQEKGCLLIVADGMGGHKAGEVASKMAVDIISREYFKQNNGDDKEKILSKAFNSANKKIYELSAADETYRGMGTTCTAIVIAGQTVYYAHAGDSRAYLYKDKKIVRLTEDHTYVQELVKNGDITAEEADTHPQRNVLTNAMGTKPALRVDTGKSALLLDKNDKVLICSDGLYDYLDNDELAEVLGYESLEQAADYLIAEAKRRGGKDNITVALAAHTAAVKEAVLKLTRDIDLPKLTRDADLPNTLT